MWPGCHHSCRGVGQRPGYSGGYYRPVRRPDRSWVRAIENSEVLRLVRDSQKVLEVCLTSNLQSGVVQRMSHHPLLDLLDLGAQVTINTDDPSVSGLTLDR
jgi:hypothetical protein